MLDSERFINNNNHIYESPSLQTIQRKISKQKIAAERRLEHSNGDQMFESRLPMQNYSYSSHYQQSPISQTSSFNFDSGLKQSPNLRALHTDDDAILTSSWEQQQQFHQPNTRKVTKIIPKENYSISNSRPIQPRSASASATSTIKHEIKDSSLTPNDIQRLKQVRRHEPAHVQTGSKSGLITPHSWKTDPVVLKKPPTAKKPTTEKPATEKQSKTNHISRPVVERPASETKLRTEIKPKPKRDTSASKPPKTETEPTKPPPKPDRSAEEKALLKKYMQERREKYEKQLLSEKKLKSKEENERKDKLKQLNQQIKVVAQQPLPSSLIKRPLSAIQPHDISDQRRERLLSLLGPKPVIGQSTEDHNGIPFERVSQTQRSLSSSSSASSSTESVIEIQPPQSYENGTRNIRSRFELSAMNDGVTQRHQNILRWAKNLARDCDTIENKFKYYRPDGTQAFDIVPATHNDLKYDNGNLRGITIENNSQPETPVLSKLIRPSGRLSNLNQNYTSEYQGQKLPGVGNLRDPLLEQRIRRERAATKIQATYRGYNVRKSLQWMNQNQQHLNSESNKRPSYKPTKKSSYATDLYDNSGIDLAIHFPDDKFTIGSTLLRKYLRNEPDIVPTKHSIRSDKSEQDSKRLEKPTLSPAYSDDYENTISSTSSVSDHRQRTPEKPRVIQQSISNKSSISDHRQRTPEKSRVAQPSIHSKQSTSASTSSSSSSSGTATPTSEPYVPTNVQHRRSLSPPIPPVMSPDNGRPLHQQYHHPPQPPPAASSRRVKDERRYSPNALERQLNAELHLLDGVEASMKQIDNMERLRSVALAQQEIVSLAQILKNKPTTENGSQQRVRKPSPRPASSSSSDRSRRSSSPRPMPSKSKQSHHRHSHSSSTSSTAHTESILTEREKDAGKRFRNENELQAYEKRLTDLEKKIRRLIKNVPALYDEKKKVPTVRDSTKSGNESSISEDIPITHPSSSTTSSTIRPKTKNDTSEIRTETLDKDDSEISTVSNNYHQQSETTTTEVSNIERRIGNVRDQLERTKAEYEKLKQQKAKDALRQEEDKLKEELKDYERQIEILRREPISPKQEPIPKQSTPTYRPPVKSPTSSSSESTAPAVIKRRDSSIAEEIPTATISQSKTDSSEKRIEPVNVPAKKIRDIFDDEDEEEEEKKPELKPLETPRDERDTQHDASLSIATDINASSETENNHSHQPSSDNERPILNLNTKLPSPKRSRDESESSTSSTATAPNVKSPLQQRPPSRSSERRRSSATNEYDEDFSEISHSQANNSKSSTKSKPKIDNIDIESIQEDLDKKSSSRDTNQSSTSKSSDDEQSEILVLVKKSANTTPRKQDEKTPNDDGFLVPPPALPREATPQEKTESINNDDTSHDISDDDEANERLEQENKVDKLTDTLLKAFIDEAIGQGKQIELLKKDTAKKANTVTAAAQEWMSDEDITDDESPRQMNPPLNGFNRVAVRENEITPNEMNRYEERNPRQFDITPTDFNILEKDSKEVDVITIDLGPSDENEAKPLELIPNDFNLDFSRLDEKSADEPRIESPRRIVIEEQVKLYVPHTAEQVTKLCHEALKILFDQNTDFSNRTAINCRIPTSYYEFEQQDSDTEIVRRNRHGYCQMIFDLCAELLHEMYSDNVQSAKHPEWQTAKLIPKRFYRGIKPIDRNYTEQFIQKTILEILNLNRRQITYAKWRVDKLPNSTKEKFESVLDEEIRRSEPQWINYNDDSTQLKFDLADSIFEQLIQETIIECLDVVDRRFYFSSNSTRL